MLLAMKCEKLIKNSVGAGSSWPLERLDYPPDCLDIVIVDNAPLDNSTLEMVQSRATSPLPARSFAARTNRGLDATPHRTEGHVEERDQAVAAGMK